MVALYDPGLYSKFQHSFRQVTSAFLRIKDGGRTVQIDQRNVTAKNNLSPAHLSYVPTVVLEPHLPPPISTLINMKSRYHLNVPSSSKVNDSDVVTTITNCYLGTKILRSIVSRMEELKSNEIGGCDDRTKSAKKSDLPSYCEYLRGEIH
jgi:hypothetical protein